MDLEQQLRTYLEHYPEGVVDSNKIKGVLKDFKCPERDRDILVHLIDCGLGAVLKEKPRKLGSHLISSTIREMDQRYGTNEKYALEGIRFWAKVYGIPVSYREALQETAKTEIQREETVVEVDPPAPPRPEPEKDENLLKDGPIKHSGFYKIKDLRGRVKFVLFFGFLILIVSFGIFLKYGIEGHPFYPIIITCLGQLYILKTGLPLYEKKENGKYKIDWKQILLLVLVFFSMSIFSISGVPVEGEAVESVGLDLQYIMSGAMIWYFLFMAGIRFPKAAQ